MANPTPSSTVPRKTLENVQRLLAEIDLTADPHVTVDDADVAPDPAAVVARLPRRARGR
jgi:hypothetical protein